MTTKVKPTETGSDCCGASLKNGGHSGNVCSKCDKWCTSNPPIKIYDESDRCPVCHKQPDEADDVNCPECGDRLWELMTEDLCKNCHKLLEDCTCKEVAMNDKREDFCKAVEPVIKWMSENCHPHMKIIITTTNAELVEGQMTHGTEKYLRD